jgi:hypothetical protein
MFCSVYRLDTLLERAIVWKISGYNWSFVSKLFNADTTNVSYYFERKKLSAKGIYGIFPAIKCMNDDDN